MCSLLLSLTISLQLVAALLSNFHPCLPLLLCNSCSLMETMLRKFQGAGNSRFGSFEKDLYSLNILKWQHKVVPKFKRGKFSFNFLNNAAKTCSYELKTSENIEIKHVFQSKAFFSSQQSSLYRLPQSV